MALKAPMESARIISYDELTEGMTAEHVYSFSSEVYHHFLLAFDDRSPIHVDAGYARAHGFAGPVMQGGILNGFVSHFVGMVFPGAASLLLSAELRFSQPSYLGDALRLRAKVAQKLDTQNVVVLHITFFNETRGSTVARGKVQVKIREP
jgi:acyl dehydratase